MLTSLYACVDAMLEQVGVCVCVCVASRVESVRVLLLVPAAATTLLVNAVLCWLQISLAHPLIPPAVLETRVCCAPHHATHTLSHTHTLTHYTVCQQGEGAVRLLLLLGLARSTRVRHARCCVLTVSHCAVALFCLLLLRSAFVPPIAAYTDARHYSAAAAAMPCHSTNQRTDNRAERTDRSSAALPQHTAYSIQRTATAHTSHSPQFSSHYLLTAVLVQPATTHRSVHTPAGSHTLPSTTRQ